MNNIDIKHLSRLSASNCPKGERPALILAIGSEGGDGVDAARLLALLWVLIAHVFFVVAAALSLVKADRVLGLFSRLAAQAAFPLVTLRVTPVVSGDYRT